MKSLNQTIQFAAVDVDAPQPFPLTRRAVSSEPFARLARGMSSPTFAAEILSARAQLARAYADRGAR